MTKERQEKSSVSGLTVTVFGASGHIGRYLVSRFGRTGTQVIVPYRCDDYDILPMKIMGDLGQIHLNKFHLRDYKSIYDTVKYSDVVINLIAQDRTTFNFKIRDVNVTGAAEIARACREAKVPRFIHVSSATASDNAISEFSRTKAEGERVVREEFPNVVIVRPSSIFGPQDKLINGIGQFTRMWFGFPVINNGIQIRYPLHISNIVDALVLLAKNEKSIEGKEFNLYGPKGYTYHRLVELFAYATMSPCNIISLSPNMFWGYGKLFPEIRRALFPKDFILQIAESEKIDSTKLGMADLGFGKLETLEDRMLDIARRYRRSKDFGAPLSFPPELLTSTISTK